MAEEVQRSSPWQLVEVHYDLVRSTPLIQHVRVATPVGQVGVVSLQAPPSLEVAVGLEQDQDSEEEIVVCESYHHNGLRICVYVCLLLLGLHTLALSPSLCSACPPLQTLSCEALTRCHGDECRKTTPHWK